MQVCEKVNQVNLSVSIVCFIPPSSRVHITAALQGSVEFSRVQSSRVDTVEVSLNSSEIAEVSLSSLRTVCNLKSSIMNREWMNIHEAISGSLI